MTYAITFIVLLVANGAGGTTSVTLESRYADLKTCQQALVLAKPVFEARLREYPEIELTQVVGVCAAGRDA